MVKWEAELQGLQGLRQTPLRRLDEGHDLEPLVLPTEQR